MTDEIYLNLAKERRELRDYKPPRTFEDQYNAGCAQPVDPLAQLRKY